MIEAKVTLVNNMQFTGKSASGHSLIMDADDEAGGKNAGFRPWSFCSSASAAAQAWM